MTNLSIPMLVGSLAILVFTAINKLTDRHFSPKWHYYMWMALLIVTVLPVRIDLGLPEKSAQAQEIILNVPQTITQTQTALPMSPTVTIPQAQASEIDMPQALPYIWAAGFGAVLIFRLTSYAVMLIKLRKCPDTGIDSGISRRIRVRKCHHFNSPALIGIFRPVLVLPEREMTNEQLASVCAHEAVHYRRGDIALKWLIMLIRAVHWYCPFVHFAAAKWDEYCEISCDIEATRGMDTQSETAYMMTILSLASPKGYALGTGLSENGKILKRRFTMIKNKREMGRKMRIISLICAISLIFSTIFVSAALAGATADESNIKVFHNGKEIELEHKPFVANNTLYLPIREMLNLENIPNEDITYFRGVVQFLTPDGKGGKYVGRVQVGATAGYIGGYSHGSTENIVMAKPVVLSGNTTYVPYDYFFKMRAVGLFEDFYAEVWDENEKILLITGAGIWNEEKNFSLELPLALQNDFIIAENEDSVTFSNDKGTLFTVHVSENAAADAVMTSAGMTYTIEKGVISDEMVGYIRKSMLPIVRYTLPEDHALFLYPCKVEDYRLIASRPYSESHPAVDLVYAEGTNVVASVTGTVIEQGYSAENGNYIRLYNGTNAEVLYAHLKDVYVKQGDKVTQGDVIGTVGKTGMATGAHLHFEIKINDKHVDPQTVWKIK